MKYVYLFRHAKSSWDFPELTDMERPLNKRGKRNAPEMGKRLRHAGIQPDLMISSPARRAITTAWFVADEIGIPREQIRQEKGLYHAGIETMLRIIQSQPSHLKSIMLFGHNPGFTDFADVVGDADIDNIPTAGLCLIEFKADRWEDVKHGELVFFDYPKNDHPPEYI